MNKLYLIGLIGAIVCGAYFYGANVADAKCKMNHAQENLQTVQNTQIQIIESKRKNHETVYKTGVRDIRNILCDKYTIAE